MNFVSNDKKITAVIALYNPNDFFQKCLDSILNQSRSIDELILVNDGGSSDLINKVVVPEDKRVKYFYKENGGVASARNFALSKASGDYIAFVDQDDYWYPEKIEHQLSVIDDDIPTFVISNIDIVDSNNQILIHQTKREQNRFNKALKSSNKIKQLIQNNYIYSSTPLIHRSIFDHIGGFKKQFDPHDDWEMYLRIVLHNYPFKMVSEPLSVWRYHGSNESSNFAKMAGTRVKVLTQLNKAYQKSEYFDSLANALIQAKLIRINELLYRYKHYRLFRNSLCNWLLEYKRLPNLKTILRLFKSLFK